MTAIDLSPVSATDERAECPDCLSGNLSWLLTQAHYALATRLAAALEPLGLTPRGHTVLSAALTGQYTQKQLAGLVGLDKTTMVAALDDLERAGFARRVPSETDRRAHVVQVTPEGRKQVTAANRVVRRVQTEVMGALGPGADEFLDSLGQLVRERLAEPAVCTAVRRREPR